MQLIKLISLMTIIIVTASTISCTTNKHFNNEDQSFLKKRFNFFENEKINSKIEDLSNSNIVYFDLNKYNILYKYTLILDNHANFLYNNPHYRIIIEGHADERGTPEYNIALGERRAKSVKMYLQSKGVLNEQIEIISYGKEKPILLGHNEEAYSKNRRAVLKYQ